MASRKRLSLYDRFCAWFERSDGYADQGAAWLAGYRAAQRDARKRAKKWKVKGGK